MRQRVFVSYVFEDARYRNRVVDWAQKGLLGAIEPVFEEEDVRAQGEIGIQSHLRPIMRSASGLLVLVGQDSHNRRWVDAEVHFFKSAGMPIVLTRVPETTGAAPLEVRENPLIPFTAESLLKAFMAKRGAK